MERLVDHSQQHLAAPPPPLPRLMLLVMLLGPNTIAGALGVPVMTIGAPKWREGGSAAWRVVCGKLSAGGFAA